MAAFFASLVAGPAPIAAGPGVGPQVSIAIHSGSMTALFGMSALLHRRMWAPKARRVMRRLDQSMIFFLIAGAYTAVAPLALHGTVPAVILTVVGRGGAVGVVIERFWLDAPLWAIATPCVPLA